MTPFKNSVFLTAVLCACSAWGVSPHIGYVFPAGAARGTNAHILLGGQFLKGVSGVRVSGGGVTAADVHYGPALNNKALQELRKAGTKLLKARRNGNTEVTLTSLLAESDDAKPFLRQASEHPLLRHVDGMTIEELEYWAAQYGDPKKRQPNPAIAETALLEISVAPDAAPGWRDLRLVTPAGLTNPLRFYVGALPEIPEREPNDRAFSVPPVEIPAVFNGQILPGDRDRFALRLRKGQRLVVEVRARALIPYLADAVPGWFQAVLALRDSTGKEVAYADDFRFDPDPVLLYEIPDDGDYELEVHDALYRGREDFVYRITAGELPFVTHIYPLGGRTEEKATVSLSGWNLSSTKTVLDTVPGSSIMRQGTLYDKALPSNSFSYAVDTLPETEQREPNDSASKPQRIDIPAVVNGVIERPDDVDIYRFEGHAGQRIVAEVMARRVNSPLDSLLRLTDASGRVLAWNDDHEDQENGLVTHQADSCLTAELKEDGAYLLQISDTQHNGGAAYAYRLRASQPRPDFALRVTPSCVNLPPGRDAVLCVHALRRDGFDGAIDLSLKEAPPGFTLSGARIPAGHDSIRMTLRAPRQVPDSVLPLRIQGSAGIDGVRVCRDAVPAEDMMQAFIYRHLVPAQELLAMVISAKRVGAPVGLAQEGAIRIPAGGSTQVLVNTPPRPMLENVRLELSDPPKGISLQDLAVVPGGLQFSIKADGTEPGCADNLIVQAFVETESQQADAKPAKKKQRTELGPLPAIPIEVVQP